jgi:hypothetical protein
MKIEYKLEKKDFLIFQLFSASRSEDLNRKQRRSKHLIPVIYVVFGIIFFVGKNYVLGSLFTGLAIVWYIYFPVYAKARFKRYFEKYITDNYPEMFESYADITLDNEYVYFSDQEDGTKVKLSETVQINEIEDHIFLKFKSGSSLIIPKSKIDQTEELNSIINILKNDMSVNYINEPDWKW